MKTDTLSESIPDPISGKSLCLTQCIYCHLVVNLKPEKGQVQVCPRCLQKLSFRKPGSISKTWALLIAAIIFYIPANVLPMTVITTMGVKQSDTIISGVIYFVKTGMWPIALVIFVASIIVPMIKIVMLSILLFSVMRKSNYNPKLRTKLYRITEIIGKWSMVDVYVVTILVALVNLGATASVAAGPAAIYFCLVVILTMTAAMSFDPRLIWDSLKTK